MSPPVATLPHVRVASLPVLGGVLVLVVLLRGWLGAVPAFQIGATIFVAVCVQAMPFLVLGTLISGVIAAFVPAWLLRKVLPRNEIAAVGVAGLAGVALPGCECASVPVARRLIRQGVPIPVALAFLLAAPAVNPVILVATAVAFPTAPSMVLARFLGSLFTALLMGWLWSRSGRTEWITKPAVLPEPTDRPRPEPADRPRPEPVDRPRPEPVDRPRPEAVDRPRPEAADRPRPEPADRLLPEPVRPWPEPVVRARPEPVVRARWTVFAETARADLADAGSFLVIGALAAATVNVLVPQAWFAAAGRNVLVGVPVMAALAVVLALCSEADAFVAASLSALPLLPRLVFLVVGPAVDVKLIALQAGTFGRAFVARFAPATFLVATACALLVGLCVVGGVPGAF